MALQLTKEMPSGVTGDYFKIDNLRLIPDGVQCVVQLFKDSAARAADKSPMESTVYEFNGEDNPCTVALMDQANSNPFKLCYEKLKTLPEFSGALDV